MKDEYFKTYCWYMFYQNYFYWIKLNEKDYFYDNY